VGLLFFGGLLALVYWGYWNAKRLDGQIATRQIQHCLTTNTYRREETIQAPAGSVIQEGQIVQVQGQWVQPVQHQPRVVAQQGNQLQ
jgi:predicted membrane metal-binding protein